MFSSLDDPLFFPSWNSGIGTQKYENKYVENHIKKTSKISVMFSNVDLSPLGTRPISI